MSKHILVTNDDGVLAPRLLALTDINTWQWEDTHFETTLLETEDKLSLFRSD